MKLVAVIFLLGYERKKTEVSTTKYCLIAVKSKADGKKVDDVFVVIPSAAHLIWIDQVNLP